MDVAHQTRSHRDVSQDGAVAGDGDHRRSLAGGRRSGALAPLRQSDGSGSSLPPVPPVFAIAVSDADGGERTRAASIIPRADSTFLAGSVDSLPSVPPGVPIVLDDQRSSSAGSTQARFPDPRRRGGGAVVVDSLPPVPLGFAFTLDKGDRESGGGDGTLAESSAATGSRSRSDSDRQSSVVGGEIPVIDVVMSGTAFSCSKRTQLLLGKLDRVSYTSYSGKRLLPDDEEEDGALSLAGGWNREPEDTGCSRRGGEIRQQSGKLDCNSEDDDVSFNAEVEDADEEQEGDGGSEERTSLETARGEACGEEWESLGVSLKRRRYGGIEILHSVSSRENNDNVSMTDTRGFRVAHRTRSHFRSDPSKKKLGTFSNPYQIDVDETESDSGYSDMSSSEDEEDGTEESVDRVEAIAGQAEATPEEKSDTESARRKQVEASEACSELSNDGANVNRGEKRVVQEESSKMKSNKRKQVKTPKDCSELSHDGGISNINRVGVNRGEKGAAQEESSKRKSNKRHRVQPSRAYSDMSGGEDEDGVGNNMDRVNLYEGEEEAAQKELSKRKSIKRKQVKTPKVARLFKLLIDIMLSSAKELPEELAASVSKSPAQEELSHSAESLPLVFAFEDDDPKQAERSEQDMELDQLWADLDFAIESENVGIYRTAMGQVEEINAPEVVANPATPCSKGEHELILNEQIGYTCKLCFKVVQEIRDILPSWTTSFGGSSARRYSFLEDCSSIFDNVSTTRNSYISQGASLLSDGTVWNLIPGVERSLYQHQRDAFEFLWKNLAGSIQLDQLKTGAVSEDVGGCVISHPPGTGKTRLAIMFIQTYMKAFPERRPVIVAPCGILLTWEKELKKWDINLPLHNLNVSEYSGSEDAAICRLAQKEPKKRNLIRLVKLYSWSKGSGILGLSYGLFKSLTVERTSSNSGSDGIRKILLETAGLLVLDEGHTARNDRTLIWKALEKVQTKQRIILSGTPFQNNFEELYNTLRLVRPKFAERKEITSMTNCISDASLEELKMLIKPFVHVYNGKILDDLPGLRDCVIYLDPLPQQKAILDKIDVRKHDDNGSLETEYKLSLASVHPSLLSVALSEREKSLIDEQLLEKLRLDPNEGIKTKFVMEMVRLAEALNEKVVIFSQYLQPLLMIKDHLIKQFNWIEGHEILQMDGRICSKHRQSSIDSFNDLSSNAKVLLASIKACCEGICLTGASRVVLLDIVWNPSVERQAISRAYRLGQDKIVYIYRLITSGTSEGVKYRRQVKKDHLSKLVFNPEINLKNVNSESRLTDEGEFSRLLSEDKILEEMASNDKLKDMFVKIYYRIKESNLTNMLS